MTGTTAHHPDWSDMWWIYRPGRILHALIIPGATFRVIREDQHEPVEFPTFAEAWFFAKETDV